VNKDRAQKSEALRYVVSKLWFPQLELDVTGFVNTSPKPLHITDVDVYASIPDDLRCLHGLLIDCKTLKQGSPINRALWQHGLMARMNATIGICIMKKEEIDADHRYLASRLGITLLSEREFPKYAEATSPAFKSLTSNLGKIELWDRFFGISNQFAKLQPALDFSKSGFWMTESYAEACRKVLILARKLSVELDPGQPTHFAIVLDLAALFMHAFAILVNEVFSGYLLPEKREDLSNALLILIYGGRESYEYRNGLKRKIAKQDHHEDVADLTLPDWDRFIQLVRQALEAPLEVQRVPLLLRELGWGYLAADAQPVQLPKIISTLYRFAPKFALLGAQYLCRASGFAKEFEIKITRDLADLAGA
jgi:hypothetical protein